MARVKSPEERSEVLERANAKAKKGYRHSTKKLRNVTDEEMVVLTDMMVSLRLVGYSSGQMAAILGLSKGQINSVIKQEPVQKRIAALRTKLPEAALNLGKAYLVEAVQAVVHVLRTEKDNALVLKAAAEIFDRFGIPKTSRTEKIEPPDPDAADVPASVMNKLRTASPEIQEKIASLHESFTEGVERILTEASNGNSE